MRRKHMEEFVKVMKDFLDDMLNCTEEKPLPSTRWRAKKDKDYYFISSRGDAAVSREALDIIDAKRWKAGNYFKTRSKALEYQDKVVATMRVEDATRDLEAGLWYPYIKEGRVKAYFSDSDPCTEAGFTKEDLDKLIDTMEEDIVRMLTPFVYD